MGVRGGGVFEARIEQMAALEYLTNRLHYLRRGMGGWGHVTLPTPGLGGGGGKSNIR